MLDAIEADAKLLDVNEEEEEDYDDYDDEEEGEEGEEDEDYELLFGHKRQAPSERETADVDTASSAKKPKLSRKVYIQDKHNNNNNNNDIDDCGNKE